MSDELTGSVVGDRYEVGDLLGRGGMAAVYRAHDRALGRDVAIKVFAGAGLDQNSLKRETGEIRLLASLNHHALVTLFDAAVDPGARTGEDRAYFVMELVEGPTLGDRIAAGPIAQTDVALMLVDLADALHVVHEGGVVHRDIKPANILLSPSASPSIEFRAKLSDFGIAYLVDSTRLTTPGTIVGTAAYVSPEQATGVAPGAASDIYSLGLVILESLTRTRAFPGSLVESVTARLAADPVIPGTLGPAWVSLLSRMTARAPADRPSALEVAEAARDIDHGLYGQQQPAAVTAALAQTQALAQTAVLGATEPVRGTEAFGETKMLPAGLEATERLPAVDPAVSPRSRRSIPRRVYVALGGIVAIVIALVIGLAIAPEPVVAPTPNPTTVEQTPTPTQTPTPAPTTEPAPVVEEPAAPGNSDKPGKPEKPGNGNDKKNG